jgi:prophage tail gpP-like protein
VLVKINGKEIETFVSFDANFDYDNMGDSFSFAATFNPDDPVHRAAFKPLQYLPVEIWDKGDLVLTGKVISHNFTDDPTNSVVSVSGYSLPGVLEDCSFGQSEYPLQFDGLDLERITEATIKPHGLTLLLDPLSSRPATAARIAYPKVKAKQSETKKAFLTGLAAQRNVIWTNNEKGNLVLTTPNTSAAPVADFSSGSTGVQISSSFNGQGQHSEISVVRQATKKTSPAKGSADRPDISEYRPIVREMTSGENTSADTVAIAARGAEYLNNEFTIKIDRKRLLNDKIAYPGQIVTAKAPGAYLFEKTRLFVRNVSIREEEASETAVLTCIFPESLTGEEVEF